MKKSYRSSNISFAVAVLMSVIFAGSSLGQNVTTPRVSSSSELKQTIGATDVMVNYSRPNVILRGNDRTGKIWGQQVKYGFRKINFACKCEIPWRAGANENTTISFSTDVKVEGKDLKAGIYGLSMAVYEDGRATVIFSKNHTSWGSFFYDVSEDALRVDVQTKPVAQTNLLTYSFVKVGSDFGVLALAWDNKQIPFKIEVDTHKYVLARFRNELRNIPGFGWQGFATAARYCLNNNINQEEALSWAETAVSRNKNFNTLSVKGGLQLQMKANQDAFKTLDEAAGLASKNQLNAMGYQLLGLKQFDKAIEYFLINVKNNPEDANSYDSLGEAYKQAGDRENAIKNLKKALSLNPAPNVKANAEKLLKELGVQ